MPAKKQTKRKKQGGAKKKTSFTASELKKIEELKAGGATILLICKALGIGKSTWYRINRGENGDKARGQMELSIKKGNDERYQKISNNCIDSLELMTRIHYYDEVKNKYEILHNPITGDRLSDEPVLVEKTVTKKFVMPNPVITMFTAVNLMPDKFQSIHHKKEDEKDSEDIKIEFSIAPSRSDDDITALIQKSEIGFKENSEENTSGDLLY